MWHLIDPTHAVSFVLSRSPAIISPNPLAGLTALLVKGIGSKN